MSSEELQAAYDRYVKAVQAVGLADIDETKARMALEEASRARFDAGMELQTAHNEIRKLAEYDAGLVSDVEKGVTP